MTHMMSHSVILTILESLVCYNILYMTSQDFARCLDHLAFQAEGEER